MRNSRQNTTELDLRLVHRILRLVIEEDMMHQIGKALDLDEPAEALFEMWRVNKLKPPFDKLHSCQQLIQNVRTPMDLFDRDINEDWMADTIEEAIQQLKKWRLIHEVELDKSRYTESSKVLVLPLGLFVYRRIDAMTDKETMGVQDFDRLIDECHQKHSHCTLEAFVKKVSMSVQRSRSLSPFNISLALFLLMYGAIRCEEALKIQVDPTNNIKSYPDIISGELTRIGLRVLKRDPMRKGTLLDHIQETNKITHL